VPVGGEEGVGDVVGVSVRVVVGPAVGAAVGTMGLDVATKLEQLSMTTVEMAVGGVVGSLSGQWLELPWAPMLECPSSALRVSIGLLSSSRSSHWHHGASC